MLEDKTYDDLLNQTTTKDDAAVIAMLNLAKLELERQRFEYARAWCEIAERNLCRAEPQTEIQWLIVQNKVRLAKIRHNEAARFANNNMVRPTGIEPVA